MTATELLEIVVCVFAVYGVYALLCHLLAYLIPKADLSVGVHVDGESAFSAAEDLRYAIILTEEHRGHFQPPVFLLDKTAEDTLLAALREEGCEIYRRID